MWLPWDIAAVIALGWLIGWHALRGLDGLTARRLRPFAGELSVMFGLYALWQLAGRISVINQAGALRRGRQLWDLERLLQLPSEATMQQWLLPHGWLIQASNIYYAVVHVPAMIICLAWLFIRRRPFYAENRNNLAVVTGASLTIQLLAVAPPRFLDDVGLVDTGVLYNQSVFSSLGVESAGQLQAMPSIHVGWAFLIAVVTWNLVDGRLRLVGPIHAALTFFVVAATANHYWLDGIVAGVILFASIWLQPAVIRRLRGSEPVVAGPVLEPQR